MAEGRASPGTWQILSDHNAASNAGCVIVRIGERDYRTERPVRPYGQWLADASGNPGDTGLEEHIREFTDEHQWEWLLRNLRASGADVSMADIQGRGQSDSRWP